MMIKIGLIYLINLRLTFEIVLSENNILYWYYISILISLHILNLIYHNNSF